MPSRLVAFFIAACTLLCIASTARAQTGDSAHGNLLYNTWCAGCHGADPRQSQPHLAGKAVVTAAESTSPMTVPLLGSGVLPVSTPLPIVVEFYDPDLDHYFITADAGEQAFVDTGAVGRWLRTGDAWRSGGDTQVCR